MLRRLILPVLALFTVVSAPGRLHASPIEITGSGLFAANAPTTTITRPNTSYAFSFVVDDPLVNAPDPVYGSIEVLVLSASYQLGGVAVIPAIGPPTPAFGTVTFYTPSDRGLFNLNFSSPGRALSFYGAQIFDSSTRALIRGTYTSTVGLNGGDSFGSGTVTVGATANAVPEPTTIAMASSVLPIGLAYWLKRRRKVASA